MMGQTDSMHICISGAKIMVFLQRYNSKQTRIRDDVRYLYSMNQSDHDTP